MTLEQKLNERFEDGRDLGIEQGIEEGRNQERTKRITSMIENGFNERQIMSVYKTVTAEDLAVIHRQMTQASQ